MGTTFEQWQHPRKRFPSWQCSKKTTNLRSSNVTDWTLERNQRKTQSHPNGKTTGMMRMLMTALLTNYDLNSQRLLPKWTCNLAASLILSRTSNHCVDRCDQSLLPCAEQHEFRL